MGTSSSNFSESNPPATMDQTVLAQMTTLEAQSAASASASAASAANASATLANALTKVNNLSDVASPATSRVNLGLITSGAANQWMTGFNGSGTAQFSQPAFSNISGTVAAAQLPNPSSTTLGGIQSAAAVSHQWVASISTSGVPSLSQPAFPDISGSVAASQLPNPSASTLGGIQSAAAVTSQWIASISTSGVPSLSQPAFSNLSGSATASQMPAFTGDVTTTAGTTSTTIASSAVTNAKLANMNAHTYKGNNTGSAAAPIDLTATQLTAELNTVVGDSGSGGTQGLVPAPPAGGAAAFKVLMADGTFKGRATSQSLPSNPTGTTSSTGVMMGLAGSITPTATGRVLIVVSGSSVNSTALDGLKFQLRYGTGSAPANGAALTGTTISALVSTLTGATQIAFSTQAVVTALALNTAIWIDLSLSATTGGTASLSNISISAVEL